MAALKNGRDLWVRVTLAGLLEEYSYRMHHDRESASVEST